MGTRVACFDLGVEGACIEAEIANGNTSLRNAQTWNMTKVQDQDRYLMFMERVGPIVSRADVTIYEHVQFNRGFSSIPGMRAILLAVSGVYKRPCFGVNVSTLKAFAIGGKAKKDQMESALEQKFPLFHATLDSMLDIDDNLVDAAWLAHWAAVNLEVSR